MIIAQYRYYTHLLYVLLILYKEVENYEKEVYLRNDSEQCGFSASGGSEQRHKLIFINVQGNSLQYNLAVKCLDNVFHFDQFFHFLSPSYQKIGGVLIHNTRAVLWPLLNSEWV